MEYYNFCKKLTYVGKHQGKNSSLNLKLGKIKLKIAMSKC